MEVVDSIREKRVQIGETYWGIEMDWHSVTFKPFSETEIGLEYTNRFAYSVSPKALPVECVQFALTDLLCLPDEQRQTQVNRLSDFVQLWGDNGYTGIQSSYSRLHDAFDLIPGIQLNEFDDWLKDNQIITKNLPSGSNRIHLRDRFYQSFVGYINEKISAVSRVINDVERSFPTKQATPITSRSSHGTNHTEVFINNDARLNLINELMIFVDEANQADLSDLINGKVISQPVIVNCQQVRIGQIFYEFVKEKETQNRKIQTPKSKLAEWICSNLKCTKDGQPESLTKSVMLRYLSGHGFAQYR